MRHASSARVRALLLLRRGEEVAARLALIHARSALAASEPRLLAAMHKERAASEAAAHAALQHSRIQSAPASAGAITDSAAFSARRALEHHQARHALAAAQSTRDTARRDFEIARRAVEESLRRREAAEAEARQQKRETERERARRDELSADDLHPRR